MSQGHVEAVTERVAALLRENPSLRDDDRLLQITYLEKYYDLNTVLGQEAFSTLKTIFTTCPSYETLRRSRQKIQESGKYLGNNRKKRNDELNALKAFSRKTPEQIINI